MKKLLERVRGLDDTSQNLVVVGTLVLAVVAVVLVFRVFT